MPTRLKSATMKTVLELVEAQSNLENTLFSNTTDENGKAGIVIGTSDTVTNEGKTNVATFTFKLKETAPVATPPSPW